MNSLLVVGSLAYDTVETSNGKFDNLLGGSATYFSAAASFFSPVHVVGVIGDDFKEEDLEFFKKRNVDFSGVEKESGETFRWSGRYSLDFSSRETLFTHLNVFEHFDPKIPESLRKTPFVFLANIGPQLQLNVLNQIDQPKFVALDTMNYWIDRSIDSLEDVISRVDGLIINDEEAKQLTGKTNLVTAMLSLQQMGPKVIIVKKGEHGVMMRMNDEFFFLPAFPVDKIEDPTGAGDTFAGGYMGHLAYSGHLSELAHRNAVVFGSALASYCVEGIGPKKLKSISKDDVYHRYRTFQKLTHFEFTEKNVEH